MEPEQRHFFRNQLRSARAAALADAEGFQSVTHVLELLGQQLCGRILNLGKYEEAISRIASLSPLSSDVPSSCPEYHTNFAALYLELRQARNDAAHQGAYARNVTGHAVDLAIVLEDALMSEASYVSQFMARDVAEAKPWHPISHIRQQMLKHAFSYLPICHKGRWCLIPEYAVARYLRDGSLSDRKKKLATRISEAVADGGLKLITADTTGPTTAVSDVLKVIREAPVLVVDKDHDNALIGLLTASDIL